MKNLYSETDSSLVILASPLSKIMASKHQSGTISLIATPRRPITSVAEMTPEESDDLQQMIYLASQNIKSKTKLKRSEVNLDEDGHVHFHFTFGNLRIVPETITVAQIDVIKELFA